MRELAPHSWKTLALLAAVLQLGSACNCGKKAAGVGSSVDGGGSVTGCGLRTCASAGATCGPIGDGCGAMLECGICSGDETCGGGGKPSICGGSGACVPRTCASLGATCGSIGDGCGHEVACGTCAMGETCGGGGKPFQCGTSIGVSTDGGARLEPDGGCLPMTCATEGATCGPLGDGCGGLLQCGNCAMGETCGGAGHPSQCGTPSPVVCTARTCAQQNATCGFVGDGCGGALMCGACSGLDICGGGGVPNTCGGGDAGSSCTNLCVDQVTCSDGGTTTLTGIVYAPTNPDAGFGLPDPLPNALVYIPNGPVLPFPAGVTCDVCGATASGSPLVTTTTGADGTFTLTNVPAGVDLNLVIQLGRWRRQIPIPAVSACSTAALTSEQTRMPRNHTEGDIPLIAMVTGKVDSTECVLEKMGIDPSEFTTPDGGGRVQLFVANGATDSTSSAPPESALTGDAGDLTAYDLVILACVGSEVAQSTTDQQYLIDYTNLGGRVYATHYSYVWLDNDPPFEGTATWTSADTRQDPTVQATINTSFPKGALLSQWLDDVGASTTPGQIPLGSLRNDFTASIAPSETWISWDGDTPSWPLHYTFNTPVGADAGAQCGRVVFSDFHVENENSTTGMAFPSECTVGPMTPQEKVLEFMLFDLASCVTQDVPPGPVCVSQTCAQQGFNCGDQGDGCGNELMCGGCTLPATCGGGGVAGVCGTAACVPETCTSQHLSCGPGGNGCGLSLDCGGCDAGTCGGGGVPGVCGQGTPCVPETCTELGLACGPAGNGCGASLDCGTCAAGMTCGGGGVPGQCGASPCQPVTCVSQGFNCGVAADGCGGTIECGTCTQPETCGGDFVANVCGAGPSFH